MLSDQTLQAIAMRADSPPGVVRPERLQADIKLLLFEIDRLQNDVKKPV